MTHPYHHAESSVRVFGGTEEDYLEIHTWLDATKAFFRDCRHRALRHNLESISIAEKLFGKKINSQSSTVSVLEIVEQHIREDCGGRLPTIADWLCEIKLSFRLKDVSAEQLSILSAETYGGYPEDYHKIHSWFDQGETFFNNLRHYALRHHSTGIFDAEKVFGPIIKNGIGVKIPTRYIGELHVRKRCGHIPTLADWLRSMTRRAWMNRPVRTCH